MDFQQVAVGALLLVVSSLSLIETGTVTARPPIYLAALAFLALAVGSLLADRGRHDRLG